jgi:hypothetical protein
MKNAAQIKTRDIHPFGVRMPAELKERLDREAKINGRSLNTEIVIRLRNSLESVQVTGKGGYTVKQEQHGHYTPELTDIERQLLNVFRKMPPEKQLALLSLFK